MPGAIVNHCMSAPNASVIFAGAAVADKLWVLSKGMFDMIDKDGSGELDSHEMEVGLSELGIQVPLSELQKLEQEFDG